MPSTQGKKNSRRNDVPKIFASAAVVASNGTHQHHTLSPADEETITSMSTSDALLGLAALQVSRAEWLNGSAVDVPTTFRYLQQPSGAQGLINLLNTSAGAGLFNDRYEGRDGSRDFKRRLAEMMMMMMNGGGDGREEALLFELIRSREYTLWPLKSRTHWVVVILHLQSVHGSKHFNQVAQMVIVDTNSNRTTTSLVMNRLETLLAAGGLTFAKRPGLTPNLWVPRQDDESSCGLRCHVVMCKMMERITELYLGGKDTYDDSLWEPLSCWFHAPSVREEMAGFCAAMLMRELGYRARIVVELVGKVRLPVTGHPRRTAGRLISSQCLSPLAWTGDSKRPPNDHDVSPGTVRGGPLYDRGTKAGPKRKRDVSREDEDDVLEVRPAIRKFRPAYDEVLIINGMQGKGARSDNDSQDELAQERPRQGKTRVVCKRSGTEVSQLCTNRKTVRAKDFLGVKPGKS